MSVVARFQRALAAIAVIMCLSVAALADEHKYENVLSDNDVSQAFHTKTPWKFEVYADSNDDDPELPLKACFIDAKQSEHCEELHYYNHLDEMKVRPLSTRYPGLQGLCLEVSSSGFGSPYRHGGMIVWIYDANANFFYRAFDAETHEGPTRFIPAGPLAGSFIAFDSVWEGEETHWDLHRAKITVYRLRKDHDMFSYREELSYLSQGKFSSEDSTDIIAPEIPDIIRYLRLIYPDDASLRSTRHAKR